MHSEIKTNGNKAYENARNYIFNGEISYLISKVVNSSSFWRFKQDK